VLWEALEPEEAKSEDRKEVDAMSQEALTEETLREIIRRVVEVAHPERIILFGSAARGEMDSDSDVDLLVIKSGKFDYGRLTGDIYMNLHGVGQAVDVILATPEQVEQYRDTHCLIIAPALREGREVYRA
jgi:predicted nucleotidyltransferase